MEANVISQSACRKRLEDKWNAMKQEARNACLFPVSTILVRNLDAYTENQQRNCIES